MAEQVPAPEAEKTDFEVLCGMPENTVLPNGDTVVGDYDSDKKLIGWHVQPGGV